MTRKNILRSVLLLSLSPYLINPVCPSNLTGDTGAILTDVHNLVDKRIRVDVSREVYGNLVPGKLGDQLPEGTQVGTGDKSWAQISWPKVTTRIWEESIVSIAPNKRIVHLRDGEMLFNLDKKHQVSENFEVWTKLIQARVHGTTILLQSTPDFSRVTVLEGDLDVTNRLDNSMVHIGPGVVYEVRVGAPPAATWVKPQTFDLNNGKSGLTPLHFAPPLYTGNAPPSGAGSSGGSSGGNVPYPPGHLKHSESDIQQKADEMSRGKPQYRDDIVKKLHAMNIQETDAANRQYLQQQQWKQNAANQANFGGQQKYGGNGGGYRMSQAEMVKKACELAGNDMQKKQYYLNQLQQMNSSPAIGNPMAMSKGTSNYYPQKHDNGTRNYQEYVPFVDTSEYAPIRTAKAKTEAKVASKSKNGGFVEDLSSHAVPPISLFRTTSSATNLYLADVNQIWKHRLVQGFNQKLDSLPLIQNEMLGLAPISRAQNYFDKNSDALAQRNSLFAAQARVKDGPKDKTQQVGREMANALTLPGQSPVQSNAEKSDNNS